MNMEMYPNASELLANTVLLCLAILTVLLILVRILDMFGAFNSAYGQTVVVQVDDYAESKKWIYVKLRDIELHADTWSHPRQIAESVVRIPREEYEQNMRQTNPFAVIQCMKGIMSESFKFIGPAPRA